MVATLNQPQYQPWPIEEQVVAIYAGQQGHLDEIPVAAGPALQRRAARARCAGGDDATRRSARRGDLSDETAAKLDEELKKFVNGFHVEEEQGLGRRLAWRPSRISSGASVPSSNTRKITKAMELVASARLRRAQARIEGMRPYADTMRELIAGIGRAAARCAACRCSSSATRLRPWRSCR